MGVDGYSELYGSRALMLLNDVHYFACDVISVMAIGKGIQPPPMRVKLILLYMYWCPLCAFLLYDMAHCYLAFTFST